MGLFEEVKKNVTVRQAAELYGLKPNRSELIRCIFHTDNTPSMKVDRRYYCFGCGCTGDAVDFTAQLFGLGAREAAVKLADDFGISYISKSRDSPIGKKKDSIKTAEIIRTKKRDDDWIRCVRAYLDYRLMFLDWKKQYAPKNPKEEWNERFVELLRELSYVEYVLDILLFGEKWDRDHLVQEKRKKVEEIERKSDDYVCIKMIWKEALDHQYVEPKDMNQMKSQRSWIQKLLAGSGLALTDFEIMEFRKAGRDA